MFTRSRIVRTGSSALLAVAVSLSVSCEKDPDINDSNGSCQTYFGTSVASTVAGIFTFSNGNFPAGDNLSVNYTDASGALKQTTPSISADRKSLTLTGLPSGNVKLTIIVTCPLGEERYTIPIIVM